MKINMKRLLKEGLCIFVSSVLAAIALYSFINPNQFVGGGVGGIATLLEQINIPSSLSLLCMNIPLMIAALIWLKRPFAIRTALSSLCVPSVLWVLENVHFFTFTGDRFLAGILSGAIYGLAVAMIFNIDGSTGGSEIVARLVVLKNPKARVSIVLFIFDLIVIGISAVIFDIWSIIYSLICSYVCTAVMDIFTTSFDAPVVYYCFTDYPDKVFEILKNDFQTNARLIDAKGNEKMRKTNLVTFVLKFRQVKQLNKMLTLADPEIFAYSVHTRNVVKSKFDSDYEEIL